MPRPPNVPSSVLRFCATFALCWGLGVSLVAAGNPAHPILFVTQVPMPEEVNSRDVTVSYQSCVSPFSNHLADTAHAARGGSLHVRFQDGQVVDLLQVADWTAIPGGKPAANSIAVRNPSVNWAGDKAVFSMVVGAPTSPSDTTTFRFQLFEITLPTQAQLNANVQPVLTKVANQPPYNNVFPAYGTAGRILFASDRPYNGSAHLLQREEYLGLPTVTGIFSLDPTNPTSLLLLHHAPSGAFSPFVDAAGRVIFTSWDHLSRDSQAVMDARAGNPAAPYNETFAQTFNGSLNFADEGAASTFAQVTAMSPNAWEVFPEPRNFDHVTLIDVYGGNVNGNAQNLFLPWMIHEDGTGGEVLNHVGRQEVTGAVTRSFKNDPSLVDLSHATNPGYGGLTPHTFFNNLLATREDPLSPGTYLGVDASDVGTHGAGQIIRLNQAGTVPGGASMNPDGITVTYYTSGANGASKPAFIPVVRPSANLPLTGQSALLAANAETLYRTPVALSDGSLVASEATSITQTDFNVGTATAPQSMFTFRLRSLKPSGATHVADVLLTPGMNIATSYYVGSTLVTYSGAAWELDPVEVAPRTMPTAQVATMDAIEAGVFASVGVDVPTFRSYLAANNAALSVSRDVTRRDLHDRQQPFNLKVTGSSTQAVGTAGTIYDVGWFQIFQADLRRGYLLGGSSPVAGRRVVATPMHDTSSLNPPAAGGPSGAVPLGADGSFAAIVPAGKALTWQLTDSTPQHAGVVLERYWVTFQRGEIRTCTNCHGTNTSDQTGSVASPIPAPTNPPAALASLLQFWKAAHPPGVLAHLAPTVVGVRATGTVSLSVSRTLGSTGPASVSFATTDGSALAGVDYVAATGTLSWADGDLSTKTIDVSLLPSSAAPGAGFSVILSNAHFASIGGQPGADVVLDGWLPDGGLGTPDAGSQGPDGGTGLGDAGTDAATTMNDASVDAGPATKAADAGCGCRVTDASHTRAPSPLAFVFGVCLLTARAVRRRRPATVGR